MAHLRYVVYEARRFSGYGFPEDLIQQGNIGLMHSVKRFEPPWTTVAHVAGLDPCRNDGLRSGKLAANESRHDQSSEKVVFQPEKNDQFLESLPEQAVADVAEALNADESDVREMALRMRGADTPFDAQSEDDLTPERVLALEGADPAEVVAATELEEQQGERLGLL